jgi:hypothetical protein
VSSIRGTMRPRFGRLTQVLSAVFVLAGLGAGIAGLNSGHQTTRGNAFDGPILIGLGVTYLLIGVGLWIELPWAWWAGLALTSLVVVVDVVRGVLDGGLVVWAVFLLLFAASAVQGMRGRSTHT